MATFLQALQSVYSTIILDESAEMPELWSEQIPDSPGGTYPRIRLDHLGDVATYASQSTEPEKEDCRAKFVIFDTSLEHAEHLATLIKTALNPQSLRPYESFEKSFLSRTKYLVLGVDKSRSTQQQPVFSLVIEFLCEK